MRISETKHTILLNYMKLFPYCAIALLTIISAVEAFAQEISEREKDTVAKLLTEAEYSEELQVETKASVVPEDEEYAGAMLAEYPSLPASMRDFWADEALPEHKQDTEWFKAFFQDVNRFTVPHFIIEKVKPYRAVPFEQLTAREASRTSHLYKGAEAYLRFSPDYLRFYNRVIIPKLDKVLRIFATKTKEVRHTAYIQTQDQRHDPVRGSKVYSGLQYDSGLRSDNGFVIFLSHVSNPETLYRLKHGDKITVITKAYYLPAAFEAYYTRPVTKEIQVHAHALNEHEEHECSNTVKVDMCWYWPPNRFAALAQFDSVRCTYDNTTGDYTKIVDTSFSLKSKEELYPDPPVVFPKEESSPIASIIIIGIALFVMGLRVIAKFST